MNPTRHPAARRFLAHPAARCLLSCLLAAALRRLETPAPPKTSRAGDRPRPQPNRPPRPAQGQAEC